MGDKVLNDLLGAVHNVDVAPIHPCVFGFESGRQQVIPRLTHSFSSGALGGESVSRLHVHVEGGPEILLDDGHAVERDLVRPLLDSVQLGSENRQCIVDRVSHEESQINEIVGVGQLGEEIEVLDEIGRRISQGGEDEDSFPVADCSRRRHDGIQINALNCARVDFVGLVVVEQHRGLEVLVPCHHFVIGQLGRRLRRAKAVKTIVHLKLAGALPLSLRGHRVEQNIGGHTLTSLVLIQ